MIRAAPLTRWVHSDFEDWRFGAIAGIEPNGRGTGFENNTSVNDFPPPHKPPSTGRLRMTATCS